MTEEFLCLEAAVLGVVQGITEFLPVSSSSHLYLIPKVMGWPYLGKSFDVALHGGTLAALICFKSSEIMNMISGSLNWLKRSWQERSLPAFSEEGGRYPALGMAVIIGAVPPAVLGFALEHHIENYFHSEFWTAGFLSVFAVLMFLADRCGGRSHELAALNFKSMLALGAAQALALFPGVSRSGAVLTAARFLGIERCDAGTAALMTALPVVGGAFFVKLIKGFELPSADMAVPLLCGLFCSFVSGMAGIALLEQVLKKSSLLPFAAYRIALAAALLFWALH